MTQAGGTPRALSCQGLAELEIHDRPTHLMEFLEAQTKIRKQLIQLLKRVFLSG